jgi:hypothetical protein
VIVERGHLDVGGYVPRSELVTGPEACGRDHEVGRDRRRGSEQRLIIAVLQADAYDEALLARRSG